jgi:hypothetical protein
VQSHPDESINASSLTLDEASGLGDCTASGVRVVSFREHPDKSRTEIVKRTAKTLILFKFSLSTRCPQRFDCYEDKFQKTKIVKLFDLRTKVFRLKQRPPKYLGQ